jgi:hypothetical protein
LPTWWSPNRQRGYTSIAERIDPVALANQLNDHRVAMGGVIGISTGRVAAAHLGETDCGEVPSSDKLSQQRLR